MLSFRVCDSITSEEYMVITTLADSSSKRFPAISHDVSRRCLRAGIHASIRRSGKKFIGKEVSGIRWRHSESRPSSKLLTVSSIKLFYNRMIII